jgi:hypothetical protein
LVAYVKSTPSRHIHCVSRYVKRSSHQACARPTPQIRSSTDSSLPSALARGAIGNALSQRIGVAAGLQDKFDWRGVAAATVGAGVSYGVGQALGAQFDTNNVQVKAAAFADWVPRVTSCTAAGGDASEGPVTYVGKGLKVAPGSDPFAYMSKRRSCWPAD